MEGLSLKVPKDSIELFLNGDKLNIQINDAPDENDYQIVGEIDKILKSGSNNNLKIKYMDENGNNKSIDTSLTAYEYKTIDPSSRVNVDIKGEPGFIANVTNIREQTKEVRGVNYEDDDTYLHGNTIEGAKNRGEYTNKDGLVYYNEADGDKW